MAPRLPPASRPRLWLALVFLLGCAVFAPAVKSSYLLDDFMHASMVSGRAGMHRGPFELYDFVNDADRAFMLERGLLPWWSHPRLTIRFWRPLSSAREEVLRFATDARSVGAHGVVCGGAECRAVLNAAGAPLRVLVPGIRPAGAAADDQRRLTTPEEARHAGASYAVFGRAVTAAADPAAAFDTLARALRG